VSGAVSTARTTANRLDMCTARAKACFSTTTRHWRHWGWVAVGRGPEVGAPLLASELELGPMPWLDTRSSCRKTSDSAGHSSQWTPEINLKLREREAARDRSRTSCPRQGVERVGR
jgi:hypothetical protein